MFETAPSAATVAAFRLLAFNPTIAVPAGPGKVIASALAPGWSGATFVELEMTNGATKSAHWLWSITNVTVCGSATLVGLYHVTLSPALISATFGENFVSGATGPPLPALTMKTPSL